MLKIQKIVFTFLAIVMVSGVFAQTKKKASTKKKPNVTVQKPAEAPEKTAEKPAVVPETIVPQSTNAVPMAEREQIIIPPQSNTTNETPAAKNSALNGSAEKVIVDSLSVHPIDPSNVLYRITNWRRMDLKEKINQPFFSKNTEITKFLIEGVKSGVLTAYTNDSVSTVLSPEAFNKNMQMEDTGGDGLSEEEKAAGFSDAPATGTDDGWGNTKPSTTTPAKPGAKPTGGVDDGWGNVTPAGASTTGGATPAGTPAASQSSGGVVEYFARDLTILEIKEDYIFDKQRSRAYNSIQTISIVIPAEKTIKGFDVPVASFRYKDLDQYFRSNPKCIWYNFRNIAQHKNMADAFDLRLFNARIIKQSNPTDSFLVDLYKG
ncbi:MAG: hypothetical protein V4683_00400, partial [Bacteroidota bacterium]